MHIAVQFQDYNIGFIVMKDGTAYLRNDPTTLRGQVGSEIRCEGWLTRGAAAAMVHVVGGLALSAAAAKGTRE